MTNTCCFIGPRKLPSQKIETILRTLNTEIDRLIAEGVTTFLSGGEPGFDYIAASLIAAKKEQGQNLRLILTLPSKTQWDLFTQKETQLRNHLCHTADQIIYTSEAYTPEAIEKRNKYMVDHSQHCLCAILREIRTNAEQTIRYALAKGLKINNVAKISKHH